MPPKTKSSSKAAALTQEVPDESTVKEGPTVTWLGDVAAATGAAATSAVSSPYAQGRCYHACALTEGRVLLFGGWAGSDAPSTSPHAATISQFDFASALWSEVDATGEPHPATTQHQAVDVGGALLFIGGWTGMKRSNATTLYQLEQSHWAPFHTQGDGPPGLTFHTATCVGKKVYVFGGNTHDGQSSDMKVLDLTSTAWAAPPATGAPAKRSSHTATVVNESYIVIIGGRGAHHDGHLLNDVAVFDAASGHWVLGCKPEGSMPARYGHAAVAIGTDRVLVFGGVGDNGALLNDVWLLDFSPGSMTAPVWLRLPTEGQTPMPRAGHAMVEVMGNAYSVGGRISQGGKVTADVWGLDTAPIAPAPVDQEGTIDGSAAASEESFGEAFEGEE